MYFKIRVLLLVVITSLAFYSCSDDPASIGGDTLPGDDFINIIELNPDSVQASSLIIDNNIIIGTSERGLLGRFNNTEAQLLIDFRTNTMHDTLDAQFRNNELNVTAAWVEMVATYRLGDESAPFDFSVHKINSKWDADITPEEFQALMIDNTDISGTKSLGDSLQTFNISTDVVSAWLIAEADTSKPDEYGILLKPTPSTQKVIGYQALVSVASIRLMSLDVIISKKDGSYTDTLTFGPDNDSYVVQGEVPTFPQENLLLHGGFGVNSVINFSPPEFPHNTTINRAIMQVTVDEAKTFIGSTSRDSLVVRFLTTSLDSGINYDSTSNPAVLVRTGNKYEGDISRYVQRWLNGTANNGVIVSLLDERISLDQVVLFNEKFVNPADRPKLFITYTSQK